MDIRLIFAAKSVNIIREQEDFQRRLTECNNLENDKQAKIIHELYNTELTYLLQLEILIQYFIIPIRTQAKISDIDFDVIFGNIPQLYQVNSELMEAMKMEPSNVCEAFRIFAPFLKLYSIYAYGYKKALDTLESLEKKNDKVRAFIKRQQTRPEVAASLISLLIAPIQRVPRYRLLLQSLVENTSPDHAHYVIAQDALSKVEETATHINKLITEAENGAELVRLARRLGPRGNSLVIPGRRILRQGVVMKTLKNGKGSQQRYLALLSDALLCCKGGEKGPLTYSRLLPLRHINVEQALGSGLFKVTYKEDCMLFYTSDCETGSDWLKSLQSAINQHMTCRRTLRKDSSKIAFGTPSRMGRQPASALKRTSQNRRTTTRKTCLSKLKKKLFRSKSRLSEDTNN